VLRGKRLHRWNVGQRSPHYHNLLHQHHKNNNRRQQHHRSSSTSSSGSGSIGEDHLATSSSSFAAAAAATMRLPDWRLQFQPLIPGCPGFGGHAPGRQTTGLERRRRWCLVRRYRDGTGRLDGGVYVVSTRPR